jgi:CPA2 family monovalent cation:H+ antiporter-2/glutathione-regulated potassium-efflux system protein KefB
MLQTLVALLAATAVAVPITRRLGFGSILGYLIAGAIIGPSGFGLVNDVGSISDVADLGVVMLLFLIGLEVRPHRLWILRKTIFGLGFGQLVPSSAALAALAHLSGLPWPGAVVVGTGLTLSSTAIVLPMLGERNLLSSTAGRDSFAVLLFQDMAFIPLVALMPLLAGDSAATHVPWQSVAKGLGAIAAILVGGSFLVRPVFRIAGSVKSPEVFTATSLLLVVGTAALANWAGLSMSLGAFMAGVLLSDSEYRHEVQADIEPFEGLLLGFFFISVGMSANLGLAVHSPGQVAEAVAAMMAVKILFGLGLGYWKRQNLKSAVRFALALPEGSEFSFVLFGVAVSTGALGRTQADLATLADPALRHPTRAALRPHRCPASPGDHLRVRTHGPGGRPHPAHARHSVHRARQGSGAGGRGAPVRNQGVFRQSRARRSAAGRGGGHGKGAGDCTGRS